MLGWDDNIILPVVQREKDSCGASAEPLGSEDIQVIHTYHSVCTEDLVIRSEGFPDVQPGDILEIYHEEETFSRLLLQVKPESLYPENNLQNIVPRDTVYIEKSIAESFQLSNYNSLVVNKVDKEKVALDIVELLFKEQYLGRSEMWRLKRHLVDSVVFLNKKINFCKDTIRCTVNEMWGQGDRVACGTITPWCTCSYR